MKSPLFLALIFWLPFQAGSQTKLNYYEFWYDDQFQNRITANLSPSDEFNLNQNIQTGNLTNGIHQIHIRFRDNNGLYSSLNTQTFIKLPAIHFTERTIIAYEYWFDENYAGKIHQVISPTNELKLITNLNTNSIQPGMHQVHIRFKDDIHQWSSVSSQTIIKLKDSDFAERKIVAFEYWIDDDYNSKTFQNIAPNNNLVLLDNLNTGNINNGLHQIHIRFKDDINQWSSLTSQVFIKLDPSAFTERKINEVEYWFDNDYANKINDTVAPENNLNYIKNINTDLLSHGVHHFHIRFRDDINQWSSLQSQIFVKTNQANIPNYVNGYRYWIDNDTSSIINLDLAITTNPKYLLTDLNLANLDTGIHTIALQFRDLNGLWSQVILDTFYQLGEPRLDTITPAKGGNIGDVTCTIYGTGFYPGTKVKLSRAGFPDIEVDKEFIQIVRGQQIIVPFNLLNSATGYYDLVVEVPNGKVLKLENSFEVVTGILPDPYTEILGFNSIRVGQYQNYSLIIGNTGNVDAIGVPIWLAVSSSLDVIILDSAKIIKPNDDLLNYDTLPLFVKIDTLNNEPFDAKIYGFLISKIPAGQKRIMDIKIRVKDAGNYNMRTWADKPYYSYNTQTTNLRGTNQLNLRNNNDRRYIINENIGYCLYETITLVADHTPVAACVSNAVQIVSDPIVEIIRVVETQETNVLKVAVNGFGSLVINVASTIVACTNPTATTPVAVFKETFKRELIKSVSGGKGGIETSLACYETYKDAYGELINLIGVNSFDPNDKTGPLGAGLLHYIDRHKPFHYLINFENMDTATAPAQRVCIIDTLDLSVFDISTFEWGFIRISDTMIYLPQHLKAYSTFLDLRPKLDYIVKIEIDLNEDSGIVKWTFTTLNPTTLMEVTDPLAGFLVPNINKPEGEGSVMYSIRVKEDISNNTEVKNKACIIFDNNPSLCTNTWSNTIDIELPLSYVKQLPPEIGDTVFQVCWRGHDNISGIQDFDIYYSINGGPFSSWILGTKDTCALFIGQIDSSYQFYSIATDSAGNTEIPPVGYDAITKISCLMPEFICPENIVKAQTPGYCGAQIFFEVAIKEDCSQISISQTQGLPNGSFYPIGKTINKFIATDRSGNTQSCRFTVTIKDTIAPKFNCPPNVQLITKPLECFANYAKSSLGSLTQLSDNCPWIKPNTDISTLVISNNALTTYPLGITNVIWTVTDSSGNKNTCKQTVTVNPYTCGTPYQPMTISTTASTGKVSWKAGFCANEYNARIRPEISIGVYGNWSNWTPTSGPGLTHNFIGLVRNKKYNYQLRSKCGDSYSSNANGFFTTKSSVQNVELETRSQYTQTNNAPAITIIPNPASQETLLKILGFESSSKKLYINELNGKLISQVNLRSDDNELMLDFMELNLSQGIYIIRIDDGHERCTGRLVIR